MNKKKSALNLVKSIRILMVYVCMCVCMYVCMCVHLSMYVCMYVCVYVCMCVFKYACMHVCTFTNILIPFLYKEAHSLSVEERGQENVKH